jgi:uncharacterized membrane protein YedE/YeeE
MLEAIQKIINPLKLTSKEKTEAQAQAYWSPYKAGFGLGLVLLAAFIVVGHGLGASGAFTSTISSAINSFSPEHVSNSEFYKFYYGKGNPLADWYVIEMIGVLCGGFLSGYLAHRIKRTIDKGDNISVKGRLWFAFTGGIIMGFGSKLARGCTSGQALTGGALLNVGSWVFMIAIFIGGYSAAYFVRRQWR